MENNERESKNSGGRNGECVEEGERKGGLMK